MMKKVLTMGILSVALLLVSSNALAAGPVEGNVPFDVNCKSALLMDAATGTVVCTKEETLPLPVASVNKIMTILLCMEAIDDGRLPLETPVNVSANAQGMGGSQVLLEAGGDYTVSDMIKSMIVASGNDACVAMAECLSGSETLFVQQMNAVFPFWSPRNH